MDFWDLLKALFGGGFSVDSPRTLLIKYNFTSMLNPPVLQLEFQKYYNWISMFLWFAVALLGTEGVVRIYKGFKNDQLGYQIKQWCLSILFFSVGIPLVPGLLVAARSLANLIGKYLIMGFANGDVTTFLAQLSSLTGIGPIDFVIGIVQLVFLFQLTLSLYAIPLIFMASCILFLVGVTVRWWGDVGDEIFRLSITVTLFGVCGNAVLLVIVGLGVAIGQVSFPGNTYAQAIINTIVIIIAGTTTFFVLKRFGKKVKTIGQSAQRGFQGLRGKMHGDSTTHEEGGNDRQLEDSVSAHSRHGHTAKSREKHTEPAQVAQRSDETGGQPTQRDSSSIERRSVRNRRHTDPDTTQVVNERHKSEPSSNRSRSDSGAIETDTRRSRPASSNTQSRTPRTASTDQPTAQPNRSMPSPVQENRPSRGKGDPPELNARTKRDARNGWNQQARDREAVREPTHSERSV